MHKNWPELIAAVSFLDQVDLKKVSFCDSFKEQINNAQQKLKSLDEGARILKCLDLIEAWSLEANNA